MREQVLKSRAKRSVVVCCSGDDARVWKRFHDPKSGAWRDRLRSKREAAGLIALAERGVAVPQFFERRRRVDGWEVGMEYLSDAVSLDAWLDLDPQAREPGASRVAESLGALLAKAHRAGLVHGDLHAGNVLLGSAGHAYLVDFQSARVRGASLELALRGLVAGASAVRERVSKRFLASAFEAWRGAVPSSWRAATSSTAFAEELDERARRHRRRFVERDLDRWTRPSSSTERLEIGGRALLRTRGWAVGPPGPADEEIADWSERPAGTFPWPGEGCGVVVRPSGSRPAGGGGARAGATRGDRAALLEGWRTMGRLSMHRLPAAQPRVLALGAAPWALYWLPEPWQRDATEEARRGVYGRLEDRGLVWNGAGGWVTRAGDQWLGPDVRVRMLSW